MQELYGEDWSYQLALGQETTEPEDESEVGSKILPNPQLHLANLTKYKREDYKHWKPWNKDKNLPKWAETSRALPFTLTHFLPLYL